MLSFVVRRTAASTAVFFLLLTFSSNSFAASYDAYFLDQMLKNQREVITITELAQEKSTNLELKRIARKLKRETKHEMEKMLKWRNNYYGNVPEFWILPTAEISELRNLEGVAFDLKFVDIMISHYQQGRKRLLDAREKGEKAIITSYAGRTLNHFDKHLDMLRQLKKELWGD